MCLCVCGGVFYGVSYFVWFNRLKNNLNLLNTNDILKVLFQLLTDFFQIMEQFEQQNTTFFTQDGTALQEKQMPV